MSSHDEREAVVVTGGVGGAVAHAFAKRGARVGLLARGDRGLESATEVTSPVNAFVATGALGAAALPHSGVRAPEGSA